MGGPLIGDVDNLIADIERRGFRIRVKDGRLQIRDGDRLPADVRQAVIAHRSELLSLITLQGQDAHEELGRMTRSGRIDYTVWEPRQDHGGGLRDEDQMNLVLGAFPCAEVIGGPKPGKLPRLLDEAQATVQLNDTGIVMSMSIPLPPEIVDAARCNCWLFRWGLLGAQSGHGWMLCSVCHEPQLLAKCSEGRRRRMTSGCPGTMTPITIFSTGRVQQGARPPRRMSTEAAS